MSKQDVRYWGKQISDADMALMRLLAKLELIDKEVVEQGPKHSDYGPITHYAMSGYFEEWEAIQKIAEELQIRSYQIDKARAKELHEMLTQEPLSKVALATWRKAKSIPVEKIGNNILVAMANPLDNETRLALEFELEHKITIGIGIEREILPALAVSTEGEDKETLDLILKGAKPLELKNVSEVNGENMESSIVEEDPNAAPVVRLVNKIFSDAVQGGASDVHINPQSERLEVKARVDGIMRPLFVVPSNLQNSVVSRIKLISGMDISEKRRPQDGRLRLKTNVGVKDLRMSTIPTAYGENIVVRILSSEQSAIDFGALGMNDELRVKYEEALKFSSRVNLVVGPTGSGKTSTLYASLFHLHDGEKNIITLEDPIEYRIDGISQIQVNPKIGLDFAEGLRSVLRQDPDIIFIGEIRDLETAAISMQVAQTGHLVLSTLHTNSAPAAITRLMDLDLPPYLIASSLGSVLAQRLVRRLCPACSKPHDGGSYEKYRALGLDPDKLKEAVGCEECGHTGYQGRIAVYSFLEVTHSISEAIRDELGEDEIAARAKEGGFVALSEAGVELLNAGITSISEIERVLDPLSSEARNLEKTDQNHSKVSVPKNEESDKPAKIQKRKLLLVEDDADTRDILRVLLQRDMYEVVEACDGQEALDIIYEEVPDLVVSDVMMPKLSGIELLAKLRGDSRLRDLPVLMLTANDTEEAELKLLESGANDFVSKTTNPEILLTRLRRLL